MNLRESRSPRGRESFNNRRRAAYGDPNTGPLTDGCPTSGRLSAAAPTTAFEVLAKQSCDQRFAYDSYRRSAEA